MQLNVLFTLGFPSASLLNSLTMLHTITRRTVLQKVPHRTLGALCACKHRVSGSFHSPPGVLFTFPSQYCFTIGHQVVFRLGGCSPRVPCGFHVSAGTLDTSSCLAISSTGLSPSLVVLSNTFYYSKNNTISGPYPFIYRYTKVWPPPLSLATTNGISVDFFSSAYLDVSLRRVPFLYLWIQYRIYISSI